MELSALIQAMSDPLAYPSPPAGVQVRQTHISVVFLAEGFVYKIKKPVDFGFLDFSSLDRRKHFCQEEVRLNARLAPGVYRGVVPVTRDGGRVHVEGTSGDILEWAVKMDRLRDEDRLEHRISTGGISRQSVIELGRRVAEFHESAERSPRVAEQARFENVAAIVRENLTQAVSQAASTLNAAVLGRVCKLSEEMLVRERTRIDARAQRGLACDTHGDLRLEHVYLMPERSEHPIVIIDCIEFNERYRFADPVADMAFLVMDFKFHNRADLAAAFADSYFEATRDADGRSLLPLYIAYRAIVRSKVEALKASELEMPEDERARALKLAQGYWMLALGDLEQSYRRPCVVLVGGLPGTGKSSLAKELAQRGNFVVIRSDVVRKELAGVPHQSATTAEFGQGIYTREWTRRTYAECLRRAEKLLISGQRVLVDASFASNLDRRRFLEMAERLCVPAALLICRADQDVVRRRLATRRGDASDADWAVYAEAKERWEPLVLSTPADEVTTNGSFEDAVNQASSIVARITESSDCPDGR